MWTWSQLGLKNKAWGGGMGAGEGDRRTSNFPG